MTTPAEAAASAARQAASMARRQGAKVGLYVDPAETRGEDHYRQQHEERAARMMEEEGANVSVTSDYEGMTVEQLKGLCRDRDLKVSGTKDELIERLEEFDMERRGDVKTPAQMEAEQATGKPEPVYDDSGNLADVEYPPEGTDSPHERNLQAADELQSAEERLAEIDADDDDEEGEG